jgi:hypothetical protein
MLESVLTRVLLAVFGGGGIPGVKTATTVIDLTPLAATAITTLANCTAINMQAGKRTLTLTIKGRYNAAATRGARVHVVTSTTNASAGTHTAAMNLTVMTDAAAHFVANELIGLTIQNVTDGSSGVITGNTETTVTVAALLGGTTNRWNLGDVYSIPGADYDNYDWDSFDCGFAAGGVLRETRHYDTAPMYAKVRIENLDAAQAITDLEVISALGN